jgi:tetratricopeptide (TPR) repeat protein
MDKLLNDTEAAIHLGITKELLYAYIRNAPKKHLGDSRKLKSQSINGENFFEQTELDNFDNYLKEPWARKGENRPSIPSYIKDYLKTEIEGKCPITGKGYPLEDAHITPYAECLNHHHHNLIRISKEVHTKIDNEVIFKRLLKETKDELIYNLKSNLKVEEKDVYLFSAPNPNPIFIGRSIELLELTNIMQEERLIIIEGLGGIGKTQLLLNAIQNVRYHCPLIWIDIRKVSCLTDLKLFLNNSISEDNRNGLDFITFISGKQVSIVFDGIEKLLLQERDEIEDFITELMINATGVQLIITSQLDLSSIDFKKKNVKLRELSKTESCVLLDYLLENQYSLKDNAQNWLLNFCNGHPLSLKLVSSLIKFYKSYSKVIAKLQRSKELKDPTRRKHNKHTALDLCFKEIFDLLTENQITILHHLLYFPGGMKDSLADGFFNKFFSYEEEIAWLMQFFFVDTVEDIFGINRYYISPSLCTFISKKIEEQEKQNTVYLEVITHIMIETLFISHEFVENGDSIKLSHGLLRLDSELPNIISAFRIANKEVDWDAVANDELNQKKMQIIGAIAESMGKYCFVRGYFDYGTSFSEVGIKANIRLGNIDSAAIQYMYLGQIQLRQYDIEGMEHSINQLKNIYLDTENIISLLYFEWLSGRLACHKNKLDKALNHLLKAANLIEKGIGGVREVQNSELRSDTEGNLSLINSEIADTYNKLKDYEKSQDYHEKAIHILEKINEEFNLLCCYNNYAHNLIKQNKHTKGIEYYFKAIKGFKGINQYEYVAKNIADLGNVITNYPEISKNQILDKETLFRALISIGEQIKPFLNLASGSNKYEENIPLSIIGLLYNHIRLISFSDQRSILLEWTFEYAEEINVENLQVGILSSLLNLGHAIGSIDHWRDKPENKTLMVNTILQSCLIINGGPDIKSKTQVFHWLSEWMKFVNLDSQASPQKLFDAGMNYLKSVIKD